ncbi:heme ABC transporter permease CcmC [Gammaproteobacteria bacterium]|nr:heme ABC transporter permease CcmC [Gammaproteobacteria bacterium]MDC0545515.1 heme ABC transporter permease CcmC [Gammaproteobacteria bacterium]MDC0577863.1 heme ABC transporter permease CcmC [Gammaproteobacteria bacterium]MDC3323224.1 heme ABC transporter permease CcmC [Gammaproteobacteria bacterium]|tara:strand:+ start:3276 stop:4037 length:762 start_codon:yes stop_codon:yes gene_type:complete
MSKLWLMIKKWLIEMGSPPLFYKWSTKILPWLFISAILILGIGLFWGLLFAPTDYKQGDVYRILYIHVPSAILGQSIFMFMAFCGFINVIWRAKISGMMLKSAAPIGVSFTLLALVTGSIWGKPTWGTWWVWDARLTSTLILFFIYAALIGLHSTIDDKTKADRAVSILSIVGLAIIPVIKKSVDWWQTLHQPSTFTITSSPSMSPDMYQPLLLCLIGFYLFFALLLTLNLRNEILERERTKNWVKQLLGGVG